MQVHWSYFGCTKEDEERIQRYWEDRQRSWEPRFDHLGDDVAALQVAVSQQAETPQWHVQAALHLSGRTVVAESDQAGPEEALDHVIADLTGRLDGLAERPEKVTLRREGIQAIVPLLERCRSEGRSDVFFAWLAPLIGTLAAHVRRELRLRERQGQLPSGQMEPADILDTVLVRAYDRFDNRATDLPLDLWLLQLADESLEQSCRLGSGAPGEVVESLEQRLEQPSEEPRESLRDRWVEWATRSETVALSDSLPAMPPPHRWDSLDLEAKQTEMDRMLSNLPRIQRQALVLHTVYGFSPAEIADFQNRSEDDVLFEIHEGRRTLEQFVREETLSDEYERYEV